MQERLSPDKAAKNLLENKSCDTCIYFHNEIHELESCEKQVCNDYNNMIFLPQERTCMLWAKYRA